MRLINNAIKKLGKFLYCKTSQSLLNMPGYIVNFQEKEALENVRYSSYFTMKTFSKTSIMFTQYYSILNECYIKHDAVINRVYLKNREESIFDVFPMNLIIKCDKKHELVLYLSKEEFGGGG